MKATNKKSFVYYLDWAEQTLALPSELRLKIDDAIKHYILEGTEPTEPEVRFSMFALIKAQIDRDSQRYQARCDKNRDNAYKRWDDVRTNTNAYNRIQSHTNDADTDKDTNKDTDKDNKESIEKATIQTDCRSTLFYNRAKDLLPVVASILIYTI